MFACCYDVRRILSKCSRSGEQQAETLDNKWLTVRQTAPPDDRCEQSVHPTGHVGRRQDWVAPCTVAHRHG